MHLSVAEAGDGELVVRTRCVELGQVVQARGHVVQHRATPFELVGVERLAWLLHHAHAVHERLQRALVLLLVVEPLPAREQVVGVLRHALELFEQPRVRLLLLCHARRLSVCAQHARGRQGVENLAQRVEERPGKPGHRRIGTPLVYIVHGSFHLALRASSAALVVRWKAPTGC